MNTNIYSGKVLVFKSDAVDALKASSEIDGMTYTYVQIFDSVVLVSIDTDVEAPKFNRSIEQTFNKCKEILEKYNIEYEIKMMRF